MEQNVKTETRLFPTRSGKMVDCNITSRDEHGIYGWEPTLNRKTRQYVAVAIFIPAPANA